MEMAPPHVEYRAVSGVFQNIDPPRPSPTMGVECDLPPHQRRGGGYTLAGRWGVNILEDARHWIGLLEYNLSMGSTITPPPSVIRQQTQP